jgi:hypothetical protein
MNNVEKMFRNKLEHHSVDVPDGAWDKISSRLPEQKQSFRMWWTIVSATLLIFASYTSYTFFTDKQNELDKTSEYADLPFATDIKAGVIKMNEHKNDAALASELIVSVNVNNVKKTSTEETITSESAQTSIINSEDSGNASSFENIAVEAMNTPEEGIYHRESHEPNSISNHLNNRKLAYSSSIRLEMPFAKEKPAKACPFVSDYQNKSVDVYFSHDFPIKNLTSASAEFDGYKNMRQQTETTLFSFSAGARFGYNLGYKWNLHTGFNYSQINEKFEYIDPESNQTRIITIKDYVYTNGKITDSIITEEQVIIPGTTKLKVYNKFRSFDIPVIGRYTILANKNFSLSAMAGIYINLSLTERGMILDLDNSTPVSISGDQNSENDIYKSQLGLSGYGAISMAYHLTSSLDFLLEPNVRFQTESMTTADYPLQQSFNTYGISTGLRFKF